MDDSPQSRVELAAAARKSLPEVSGYYPLISVKNFGAVGDGIVDDTQAFKEALRQAYLAKRTLYVPGGTYRVNLIMNYPVNIRGDGPGTSILTSYLDGGWALTMEAALGGWRYGSIEDIGFGGYNSTYGYSVKMRVYAGPWAFTRCAFNSRVGIYKEFGPQAGLYDNCNFACDYYGFYAYCAALGAIHEVVSIYAAGTGYSVGDVLTVVDTSGTGGTATVLRVDAATGAVLQVSLSTPGEGYPINYTENYILRTNLATTVAPAGGTGCRLSVTTTGLNCLGQDHFRDCYFVGSEKAAIFLHSLQPNNTQTSLTDCVLERNAGMGLCVYNFSGGYYPGLSIENCHTEANATSGTVQIHTSDPTSATGTSLTPRTLYFRDADARLVNTPLCQIELATGPAPGGAGDQGSHLVAVQCQGGQADSGLTQSALSSHVLEDTVGGHAPDVAFFVDSFFDWQATIGGAIARTQPRAIVSNAYTPDYALMFDGDAINMDGTAVIAPASQPGALLFPNCGEYVFGAAQTESLTGVNLTLAASKYAVVTFDLMRVSGTGGTINTGMLGTALFDSFAIPAQTGRWWSFGGVFGTGAGATNVAPIGVVTGGAATTLRFSALQLLLFDTKQEALEYMRERIYCTP